MRLVIGILALQGNYIQHARLLQAIIDRKGQVLRSAPQPHSQSSTQPFRLQTKFIRNKEDVQDIHALVLPGGESSTMNSLLQKQHLDTEIRNLLEQQIPVLATCTGCILLAKTVYVAGKKQEPSAIAHYDIELERNAYGRQVHSFHAIVHCVDTTLQKQGIRSLEGLFIRAPRINKDSIGGDLRPLFCHNEDFVVLGNESNLLATFHPESVSDPTLHRLFVQNIVRKYSTASAPA